MTYDAIIIGGGFTGLSLAQQLLQEIPDISICIIHENQFPNEQVSFKVGEATIEIGAYYLRKIFGAEFVDQEYFLKMGMRFINTDGDSYKEMGISSFPFQNSYQFERGRLENDAFNLIKDRVEILQNTRFIEVKEESTLKNIYVVELGKEKRKLQTKWLIDASGMKRVLTQKYGLSVKHPLPNSSVWFRVDGAVLVNEVYPADIPDAFNGVDRSVSSLHIDGKGYWIWVLRLSESKTSVGIAFSENIHQWDELSTLDKTLEWLKCYETTFYNYLKQKEFAILDFKYLRKYARVSLYCISENRTALSGDAFAFIDPVYSGGLDIICITNTCIVDVIAKDMKGIDNAQEIVFYNRLLKEYLSVFSACFDNMYENKDNWYYIFIKYMADSAMYFGGICPFIMNNGLNDFDRAKETWGLVCQIFEVYKEALVFINKKDLTQYDIPDRLNITGLLFASINSNVLSPREDIDEVIRLLNDNLTIMEQILEYVSQDKNLLELYRPKEFHEKENWNDWRYKNFFNKVN